MKWADAVRALLGRAEGDAALMAALGGPHIYRSGTHRKPRIPSVEYTVVVSTLSEAFEPALSQWDIFAESEAQLLAIEKRLRRLFHWGGWRRVGSVSLSSTYEDSRDHPEPEAGRVHRSIDFRHQPVRNRGW